MAIKPIQILISAKDEASGVFSSLQAKAAGVAAAILAYFGIDAFASAVKSASELEAKLSELKAASGATADEMKQLRQAAEQAASTTQYTATQATSAMVELAKAGLSAKDVMAALPAAMSLAQAGGIELARATEIITAVTAGMGLAFTDAGRVADVLALGANASKTSVQGLGEAMSYAAPIAKTLGIDIETTVAIIGQFATGGIDASRAGTALNSIMGQFADPASKFRAELATAGITTNDFGKMLHQLAASGYDGQKAILAVGTEAGPALRSLLNLGMPALDELTAKLHAAGGSAASTAATMSNNLQGATSKLTAAWDLLKVTLTTPVLPVLKDGVTELYNAIKRAIDDGTVTKFGDTLATAFKGALEWARQFLATVNYTELIAKLQEYAANAKQTLQDVGESARNASAIIQTAWGVMSAGVNTLLGLIYSVGEAFAGVGSNVQTVISKILAVFAAITPGRLSEAFKAAAAEVGVSANATWAVSQAFADKAQAAFVRAEEGANSARTGWDKLTNGMAAADTQSATSARAMQTVADTLGSVGTAATSAGVQVQASADKQRQAAESTRVAVAALKQEYEAAMAAGNVQLALEKLQAMQSALKDTGTQAQATRQDIDNAFQRLGVTSSAELAKLRDAAEKDYKVIRDAGTSSAADKAAAFEAYAKRAIAANNGVATEALKAEAAMRGVTIQTDAAGRSSVTLGKQASQTAEEIMASMDKAANSVSNVGSQVQITTEQFRAQQEKLQEIYDKYSRPGQGKNNSVLGSSDPTSVDNTGLSSLEQKKQSGTLSASDAATAQAAYQAALENYKVMQANMSAYSAEGIQSAQDTYMKARLMLDAVNSLSAASKTTSSTPSTSTASSQTITINIPGVVSGIKLADQSSADALIAALKSGKLAAGV